MRADKHATHSRREAQEVFEISIARLVSKQQDLPVVATSEAKAITLLSWDEVGSTWSSSRIGHAPIDTVRGEPSISNTWNWSRRVGLTTLDNLVYLVYKRADLAAQDEAPKSAQLMLEIFDLDMNGSPRRILRMPIPMPTFIRQGVGFPPQLAFEPARPGFELWAGIDTKHRRLLVVTQTLGEGATATGDGARLKLLLGDLDRLDQSDGWDSKDLDVGGYGLDVMHQGSQLILAYRTTPQSLTIPLPIGQIDPFFSGWPQFELEETVASDPYFAPLRIKWVDLPSLSTTSLDLPGGEHPRIQNMAPLMVVVDRPQLIARFRVVTNPKGGIEPQIDWEINGVHKLAYMLDDSQRIARGVLSPFLQDNPPSFPRTSAPWVNVQDLFTNVTPEGVGWASTWARFPLEPLYTGTDDKGLFFDYLQKAPRFALLRSRARLFADFEQGLLTLLDLRSLVYDLNHAQIGLPESLQPDASSENAQFGPFERLSQQSGPLFRAPAYQCDNTIGGSLISDREGVPHQFLSYVDLGDGGLRVIFDAELGLPDEPPPSKKPKNLDPEFVPGPGSADERWIELQATDWQDVGLPNITLNDLFFFPTITSFVHWLIEALLVAGFTLAGLTMDEEDGWSDEQVNSIQTCLNQQDPTSETLSSNDGVVPGVSIRITPSTIVADADTVWEAVIEGESVSAVNWLFTYVDPNASFFPPISSSGNPVTVALFLSGDWTIQADITRADGSVRRFESAVQVGESLFRRIRELHSELSREDPESPLYNIGHYRIGTAIFEILQYRIHFPVEPHQLFAQRIVIETLDKTNAQWRFRPSGNAQGLIDYRLRIKFESEDLRLSGLLSTLAKVESVSVSFYYGRSFTPGILMNDTRTANPRTGEPHDVLSGISDTRLASALAARPFGDAQITVEEKDVKAKVSMLPQAIAAGVITLLIGLGAGTAATLLIFLVGGMGLAIAALSAPLVGVVAAAAAVAAAVAVALFIAYAVPPIIETAVEQNIKQGLEDSESLARFEESRLLQYAGEGAAEAIARHIISKAIEDGLTLDAPPAAPEFIGRDRIRRYIFQMIHVSEGLCRVLIRA